MNILPLPSREDTTTTHAVPILRQKACIACRTRKVKCNKQAPCMNCTAWSLECVFPSPIRRCRRPRKGDTRRSARQDTPPSHHTQHPMDQRIGKLESVVLNLSRAVQSKRDELVSADTCSFLANLSTGSEPSDAGDVS